MAENELLQPFSTMAPGSMCMLSFVDWCADSEWFTFHRILGSLTIGCQDKQAVHKEAFLICREPAVLLRARSLKASFMATGL